MKVCMVCMDKECSSWYWPNDYCWARLAILLRLDGCCWLMSRAVMGSCWSVKMIKFLLKHLWMLHDVVVVWPSPVPRARRLPSGTGNDLPECFSSTFYWPGVLPKNRACVPLPLDKDNLGPGNEIGFGQDVRQCRHPGTRTSSIVAPINVAIGWTCVKTSNRFLLWLR